jgi:hypothetical protein
MASDVNPYAAPRADVNAAGNPDGTQGMFWRSGPLLMVRDGAVLPARCVKCNGHVHEPLKRRRFYWHHPALLVLILLNALIFVIVAMLVRRRAEVTFGLCPRHRRKRNTAILLGVLGVVASILMMIGSVAFRELSVTFIGLLALLVSMLIAITVGRAMFPARIDKSGAQLRGCGEAFLASL